MPKPNYTQKFRNIWLKDPALKDWLVCVESTAGNTAKCKFCHNILSSRYADLKSHAQSKKHKTNAKLVFGPSANPKIPFLKETETTAVKVAEGGMALFIAQHTSINTIDHLSEVCKSAFNGCSAADYFRMHRTKCENVIKNVIAPYFVQDLKEDIKNNPFSLLIDESTDIRITKYLGIAIIYYSNKQKRIVTTYLALAPLEQCNADAIVNAVKETLHTSGLQLSNLVGLGTDNASVMVGVNGGVYKKLKDEVPNLILTRCVCHSLQLAVSAAAKESLPRNLEYLIQETYNWFSHSSLRQLSYKQLYETINNNQNPLKIVQACQTRWLSIESAVSRILDQWEELKCHFNIARIDEKCYGAEMLYNMYNDKSNYAFLCFLRPILVDVQKVNKLFESKNIDPTSLTKSLKFLIDSLVNKITVPGRKVDIFSVSIEDYIDYKCYLSYSFESVVSDMREKGLSNVEEKNLRNRCIRFVVTLIQQIKIRLPENINILQKMAAFSIDETLMAKKGKITDILLMFGENKTQIDSIESQWNNIHLLTWSEEKDTLLFWYEVKNFRDASGDNPFETLADFALKIMILPNSNAEVERLFSQMNLIKSKLRNKMQLPMLTAILTIREGLKRHGKCCNDFKLPNSITVKIQTNATYANISNDDYDAFELV